MREAVLAVMLGSTFTGLSSFAPIASADRDAHRAHGKNELSIQVGARPYFLVEGTDDGPLKNKLMQCRNGPFQRTDFSIAHRGAALQFPEHTKGDQERQRYVQGARCSGAPAQHTWDLLRLAGYGDLLRELHESEIA